MLTLLRQGEKYGYELAEAISGEISISEGTIYPILRRLRNEGYFEVTLRESPEGPPRKYYRLTQRHPNAGGALRGMDGIFAASQSFDWRDPI